MSDANCPRITNQCAEDMTLTKLLSGIGNRNTKEQLIILSRNQFNITFTWSKVLCVKFRLSDSQCQLSSQERKEEGGAVCQSKKLTYCLLMNIIALPILDQRMILCSDWHFGIWSCQVEEVTTFTLDWHKIRTEISSAPVGLNIAVLQLSVIEGNWQTDASDYSQTALASTLLTKAVRTIKPHSYYTNFKCHIALTAEVYHNQAPSTCSLL